MFKNLFVCACCLLLLASAWSGPARAADPPQAKADYTLTIGSEGRGWVGCSGKASNPKDCRSIDGCTAITFKPGSTVRCTASHPTGWTFEGWKINNMWGGWGPKEIKYDGCSLVAVFKEKPKSSPKPGE